MKLLSTFLFLGIMAFSSTENLDQNPLDHSLWDNLLKTHVNANGDVDYQGFKENIAQVESYLEYLAVNYPDKDIGNSLKKEKLAYYINLYNAATVNLIIRNYPIKSIQEIDNAFDKKWIKMGDKIVSLSEIENDYLRKMDEPRIHFAINCASYSCPKLLNEAFTAIKLEKQLNKVTEEFINDPSKNAISPNDLKLSMLFKWYKEDFTTNGSLQNYINKFTSVSISDKANIEYLSYDWNLNELR